MKHVGNVLLYATYVTVALLIVMTVSTAVMMQVPSNWLGVLWMMGHLGLSFGILFWTSEEIGELLNV